MKEDKFSKMNNQISGMNSQSFAHQNKTSFNDPRENMGNIGNMPSRNNPHVGPHKFDYKDNVKGKDAQRAFKAKYSSGASDAKKSAGLPQGASKK